VKTSIFRKALPFSLFFAVALCGVLAFGTRSGTALGTCGADARPSALGGCRPCDDIKTPASITSSNVSLVLSAAGVQNASFTVSNDLGTFNTAGTA
jgi:hypothetical protein